MAIKSKDKIYFDTDCLSSFLWTNSQSILVQLYGDRVFVPTLVLDEIRKVPFLQGQLTRYLNTGLIQTENFGIKDDPFNIYKLLILGDNEHPKIGQGEAAVIALAKCNEATMASNNLKDISYYIEYYNLNNITTADILHEAVQNNVITHLEADALWQKMILCRRNLPYQSYSEWLQHNN